MKSFLKAVLPDLTALLILAAAAIKLLYNLSNVTDLDLFDESYYLVQGADLLKSTVVASWAPLYSAWYWILSLFQPDRVGLYLLNAKLIVVLPVFAMYVALRRYRVSIAVSLVVSLWLLVCNGNAATAPRVVHFAVFVVLIGFIFMKDKSTEQLLLIGSMTSLTASFVRPEFFLAYMILVSIFLFVVLYKFLKFRKVAIPGILFTVLLILSVSSLYFVGPPAFFSKNNRDMSAFSQHFSLHWVQWTGSKLHPYANASKIVKENLNDPKSLLEAFKNNPKLVSRHFITNVMNVVPVVDKMFKVQIPLFAERDFILMFEFTMALLMLCAFFVSKMRQIIFGIVRNVSSYWKHFLFICLLISITLIAVVVIFPHRHYLFFFLSMFMFSLGLALNADSKLRVKPAYLLLFGIFALAALVPNYAGNDNPVPYEINTVRFFQSLPLNADIAYLDDRDFGYCVYIPHFKRVLTRDKQGDFISFLNEQNISVVILGGRMDKTYKYITDAGWQEFKKNYEDYGFVKVTIPRGRKEMLIKKNLADGLNLAKLATY